MQLSYISRYSILFFVTLLFSCKKQKTVAPDFAVLQLYGWIADDAIVVTNFSDSPLVKYSEAAYVGTYGSYMSKHYISQNPQPLSFYGYPDTFAYSKPILKLNLELEKSQVYSLFLSGTTTNVDTVLVKDNLPLLKQSDSAGAVRFVNLMAGGAISINLKDEPYGSVVKNLPYMAVTEFRNFPVNHTIENYELEVRDANTNELLVSTVFPDIMGRAYNTHYWLAKSRTHIIKGIRGETTGVNEMKMFEIMHN